MSANARKYSIIEILQHWVLVFLFAFLALTGFVQAKPLGAFSLWFAKLLGGLSNVIFSHRIAGFAFTLCFFAHLTQATIAFIKGKRGLILKVEDFRRLADTKPAGRFSLRQKLDYFAVLVGSAIFIISGVGLLYPEFVSRIFSGTAVAALREIHFCEAVLATSLIIVWHIFYAHFHPATIPFDTMILKPVKKDKHAKAD